MTIYELTAKEDKEVGDMYEKAMRELDEFFEVGWKRNSPKIMIIKDRKTIDSLQGEKTPEWVIGWAGSNEIYLLDRNNFEKESNHTYSKEEYSQLMKHELCHMFFKIVSNAKDYNQFIWLNEGLAGFLSRQYKDNKKPEKFEIFLDQYSNWKGDAYHESAYAVKVLFEKFGKQKLLELITSLNKVKSRKDFEKVFKEIYNSKPTYGFFNKLLEGKAK